MELPFAGSPGAYLATLLFSLAGSCVPFLNIEAFLIAVATALPRTSTLILAAAAALGQMAGKWLVYLAGAGLLRLRRRGEAGRATSRPASRARRADPRRSSSSAPSPGCRRCTRSALRPELSGCASALSSRPWPAAPSCASRSCSSWRAS